MEKIDFESVIVAIDLSELSETVASQAKDLATFFQKPIAFVYANNAKDPATAHLKNIILKKYQIKNPENLIVESGNPTEVIIDVAKRFTRPLIVAGHRSGHAIAHFFWGSVAKNLALSSPFPVWIHRSLNIVRPKKVMLPVSLDPLVPQLVQTGENIARLFQADLELFHAMRLPTASVDTNTYGLIYEAFKEMDDRAIAEFKSNYPHMKLSTSDGEPGFEIRERARYYDLLIVAPQVRSSKTRFLGTTTTHLISSGETAILILPDVNRAVN